MNLHALAKAAPSKENWQALAKALDRKKPNQSQAKGLAKLLKKWPPWTRIVPADWFLRMADGERQPYFSLATDADVGVWAYSMASPAAYNHEMGRVFEFKEKLNKFIESGSARHLLRLRTCHEGGSELYQHMPLIKELYFSSLFYDHTLKSFVEAPFVPNLESLVVSQIEAKSDLLLWERLASGLLAIRILRLRYLTLSSGFVEALFGKPGVRPLILEFSTIGADNKALLALTKAPLQDLQELHLWGSGPELSAFAELLGKASLPSLRILRLDSNRLGDGLVDALLSSPVLSKLEELDLRQNGLTDDAVAGLVSSPAVSQLRSLTLRNNSFGNRAAQAIAESPYLKKLQHLNIREAGVEASGLSAIIKSRFLSSLNVINVMHNPGAAECYASLRARFSKVIDISR